MSGLGFPPKVYTRNRSECMNHLVKAEDDSKFGKKAAGLPAAIEPKTEIKRQNDEQFLEVISRRQYTLKMRTLTTTLKKKGFFRMSAL